jgi:hypothetical protein
MTRIRPDHRESGQLPGAACRANPGNINKERAMTYLPDTTSDIIPNTPQPDRPLSVATAVKLMYAGAALEVLGVLISIARMGSLASALVSKDGYSGSQAHSIARHDTVLFAAGALIGAAVWAWMARSSAAGRSWVPGLAVVLLCLDTAAVVLIARPHDAVSITAAGVPWLVGLAATICLRRRDATWFFHQAQVRDAASGAQTRYL